MTTISLVANDESETGTAKIIVSATGEMVVARNAESNTSKISACEIPSFFIELTQDINEDNEYRGAEYSGERKIASSRQLFIRERIQPFFYSLTQDLKIDNKYRI